MKSPRIARPRRAVLVLAVTTSLVAVGCSASGSDDTILVGMIVSQSGAGASVGTDEQLGMELVVDQINEDGGIDGREIELVVCDDASEDARAVLCYRELVDRDGVIAVLGPGGATTSAAAANVADSLQIPMVAVPSNVGDLWEGENTATWAFGISAAAEPFGESCLSLYSEGVGQPESIAIGNENTGAVQTYADAIADLAESNGVEVVARETWGPADADVTGQLNRMRSESPALHVVSAYLESAVVSTRNMSSLGMLAPGGADVVQCGSMVLPDYLEAVGPAAEGMYFVVNALDVYDILPDDHPQAEAISSYVEAFQAAYPDEEISRFSAGGYLAGQVLIQALEAIDSPDDAEALRSAIEDVERLVGAYNIVTYEEDRHRPSREDFADTRVLVQFVNGQITFP